MGRVLEVVKYGHPVLSATAAPVEEFNEEVEAFFEDLVLTMDAEKGAGLAAPQVAKSVRMLVVRHEDELWKIANPVIRDSCGMVIMREGCLSIPNLWVPVKRAQSITLEYSDEKGQSVERKLDGWPARIVLHEIDHLDGKTMLDYLRPEQREMLLGSVEF